MLLVVVLCLLTPCVIGVMSSLNIIYSLLLDNLGNIFKSFQFGGCHPLLGTAQGQVSKKNVCVSEGGDAELIGVTGAWYSGSGWSGSVGWGVILLLYIPLVTGETLKNPIPDHASEDTSKISLYPFLSPYAHLSIPGFLALGLVLPRVVPHLGGFHALGSLAEALTWGIPAVSAVAGFNFQALYQHILYWFGYKPYSSHLVSHVQLRNLNIWCKVLISGLIIFLNIYVALNFNEIISYRGAPDRGSCQNETPHF